ncbi:hypothetical protein L6452_39110 [Arctium lappa]|uniref:Uncharacterized protein n=1 Tax=Arctium lappa TaxID=4217 RepID=A0ACB8XRE5_ARCLA|nr:hypothetical protein L6452_39110 [Arctium lappa]
MTTTYHPKASIEKVKIDLFEDDDKFEEFEIDQGDISSLTCTTTLSFLKLNMPKFTGYEHAEEDKDYVQKQDD